MQPSYSAAQPDLLVVAAPSETRAVELADALRQLGWPTTLATTADQAAQAARYAACIVALTPATRDDPAVQAAIEAHPPKLIPYFPEPMILPYGSWSSNPIRLRESLADAARDVVNAAFGTPESEPLPTPSPEIEALLRGTTNSNRPLLLGIAGAVLVVLIIAGILLIRQGSSSTGNASATPTALPSYVAVVPGAGCDTGEALWRRTQTVLLTCERNDTLVSVPRDNGFLQGMYFQPASGGISAHYRVSFAGKFVSGDTHEALCLAVHDQMPGGQIFCVAKNGSWEVFLTDTQGNAGPQLKSGSLRKTLSSMTVGAVVEDAVVHFSVNGKTITTLTDNTYSSTTAILIAITDPHSTKPFSARLSHFAYSQLP